ncbi:MAG: RsmE family RNA methyltransferase, partial [Oscillospiraceae bacterium]|nr:RsmE family RNA methyltransferase [Oscillospiraceae bacterium]
MAHRYFSDNLNTAAPTLSGEEAKHVAKVLRGKAGDELIVCDGKGTDYNCRILECGSEEINLEIISSKCNVSEAGIEVILYVGYPKGEKLEWIIQKAVELGAVKIVPFFSRYCVVTPKNEDKKNVRYNRIALEAAKQSGRGIVPHVDMPITFKQMLTQACTCDTALFCYEAGGKPLHSRLEGKHTIAIITGAEGGFSAEEAQVAAQAGLETIGLGPRILRCETAPLAALSAV